MLIDAMKIREMSGITRLVEQFKKWHVTGEIYRNSSRDNGTLVLIQCNHLLCKSWATKFRALNTAGIRKISEM